MYKITYIHKDETTENTLYDPEDQQYTLVSARLNLAMGQSGDLTVEVPEDNPAYNDIVCLTDEIIVYRDGEELWRGRSVTLQTDFYRTGTLTCEGILSYLHDTYYHPFEFPFDGENGDPKILLQDIIDNHNAQVGDDTRKILQLGMITVEDPNNYIARSSIYYLCTMEALQEKFINDSLGGYFRIRIEGDTRYLDYLENYNPNGETAEQAIEFGENLLDVAQELSYSDTASVILPLGAKIQDEEGLDTDEYTTIESVNGGSVYFVDEALVKEYGWICVSVTWDDVTLPSNLLEHARLYLAQVSGAVASFTVNAVDLALAGGGETAWNVGDMIRIYSRPHDINQYAELTSMSLDLLNPEVDMYQFGGDTVSMTGSTRNAQRDLETSLGSLAVRLDNLSVNILNAVYANIEHLIADTITTEYIWAEVGELVTADIENLIADKANIEDLQAVYGSIDDLTVIVETVEGVLQATIGDFADLSAITAQVVTLLGGDITAGEITSITLSADTTVIETAVIANAVAGTVVAALLTADYIDTNLIHIGSEDGTLMIDDSTILICDADGNPRIQIGLDGTGDYNLALWDSDGNCMWNASGVTEYGINDGVIRDDMVAADAAIQGSKLDIASVAACLNADGSLILQASQVYIGDEGLSIVLAEMQQQIDSIDPSEYERYGICDVVDWFCLSDDGENPPDLPVDTRAYAEVFCLGISILGTTESAGEWTTERLSADSEHYLWTVTEYICYDGTIIWGTARCMTDGYVRTSTTMLLQEFEVMDGHVESLISQVSTIEGDVEGITNDFNLFYQDYETTINTISSSVELATENASYARETADNLVITVNEFQNTITDEVDILVGEYELIWSDVSYLYQSNTEIYQGLVHVEELIDGLETDGLLDFQVYYCLWDDDENPPDTEPYDDRAYAAVFCLGVSVLGRTESSSGWTTDRPTATDEMPYIWMRYRKVQVDGTVTWTEPTLWSDAYVYAQFSYIHETIDGIESTVGYAVETAEGAQYSVTQIEQKVDSLKLSLTNDEYGHAAIELVADGQSILESDVAIAEGIRAAADDGTGILISAGTVVLEGNTLQVNSTQFALDSSGNAWFAGTLSAPRGCIGAWIIDDDAIWTAEGWVDYDFTGNLSSNLWMIRLQSPHVLSGRTDDMHVIEALQVKFEQVDTEDNIISYEPYGDPTFYVTYSGFLYAQEAEITGTIHAGLGDIAGWTISTHKLYATGDTGKVVAIQSPSENNWWVFAAGGSSHDSYGDCPFRVDQLGNLYAESANITGYVYATDGVFNGTVYATDGSFTGNVTALGQFSSWNDAAWNGIGVMVNGNELDWKSESTGALEFVTVSSYGTMTLLGALVHQDYTEDGTTTGGLNLFCYNDKFVAIGGHSEWKYMMNDQGSITIGGYRYTDTHIFWDSVKMTGNLTVDGTLSATNISGTVSNATNADYADYAYEAGSVTGTVDASQISGTVSNATYAESLTNPITVEISANGTSRSGSGTSTISVDITDLISGSSSTEAEYLYDSYKYVWRTSASDIVCVGVSGSTSAVNISAAEVDIGESRSSTGTYIYGGTIQIGTSSVTSNININASNIAMSGNLTVTATYPQIEVVGTASNGEAAVRVFHQNGNSIYFGIGTGGENRGIYDRVAGRWLIYADVDNNTNISGTTYVSKLGVMGSDGVTLFFGADGSDGTSTSGVGVGLYDSSSNVYFVYRQTGTGNVFLHSPEGYIGVGYIKSGTGDVNIGLTGYHNVYVWGTRIDIGYESSAYGNINIGHTNRYVYVRAASLIINGDPYTGSDRSLKGDIKQLDKDEESETALIEEINQLQPSQFTLNNEGDGRTHYGYIADDVETVMPELVKTDEEGLKYLAYNDIIPLLHLKIKSQDTEIAELKDRIAELESALPKSK